MMAWAIIREKVPFNHHFNSIEAVSMQRIMLCYVCYENYTKKNEKLSHDICYIRSIYENSLRS